MNGPANVHRWTKVEAMVLVGVETFAPEKTLRSACMLPHEKVLAVFIFSPLVYVSAQCHFLYLQKLAKRISVRAVALT